MYHCVRIRIHAYSRAFTGFMHKQRPQSTSTAPQERAQPWKAMQEVQNLFKPEVPAAAETADKAEEEEPLKLNLLRAQFNSARSNIANVEEKH
ncbi:hypothetical protein BO83DRAFT_435126 [Aspergillus eucalypticola CBS 122712]|uniref:Uncharacterized protein n=1 Tax=Aspergillus eucalypticola (strain CBS 122712 / IBT 29274) TaxID=1448314 RepID=A0A317W473_ASPEC|nr:uncharacterized protein BO83DRAFT_435126 [Aspergillus eucalypticola CBS 122712]PWY80092.1 hypothetical protein BO83DRAFT_435126 [Aspergillus eucalypticola CBS 122712]